MKWKASLFLLILLYCCKVQAQKVNIKKAMHGAFMQTNLLVKNVDSARKNNPNKVSPRTVENGQIKMVASHDWTSGFFPGQLWLFYEYTKDERWLYLAKKYTDDIKKEQFNISTHDLGFMIYTPVGNGYKQTKNQEYRDVIVQAAKSLSSRFNVKTGVIRSWDFNKETWQFPVIIDNMMNLELLFEATKFTGDSSFYKIAVSHADNTIKNHFRSDYSSYHVIDYDTVSGEIRHKHTAQGYSHDSSWARGQAWALYGYTLCYRYTRNPVYLAQADAIANFVLSNKNTLEDAIPYWDYNDPGIPNVSKDASAASITASALYELAKYSKSNKQYKSAANKILFTLSSDTYTSKIGENYGFILKHSTGHLPANSEIDVPINYADYYYIEALLRSQNKGY